MIQTENSWLSARGAGERAQGDAMRKRQWFWLGLLWLAGLAMLQAGCGGSGGGGGTSNPTTAPSVSLLPTSLSFGNENVNTTSKAQTVTMSNTGKAALDITSIAVGGADPADFTETNNCASSLAAGADCAISVTFAPAAAGSLSASLTVKDNASGSPQSVALTGTATGTLQVSVSPDKATGAEGTQLALSANVSGGSGNAAITWSANPAVGSFSSATGGSTTYTIPAAVPLENPVNITASATDSTGTATGTASVTVVPFLTFTPFEYECPNQCLFQPITMHGSGFSQSGVVNINPPQAQFLATWENASTIQLTMSFDDTGSAWNPGSDTVQVCQSGGTNCTPTGYFSFGGAGGNLGGAIANANLGLDEEYRLDPGTDQILRNKLSDGSADTPTTDVWGVGFAVDNTGGNLDVISVNGIGVFDAVTGNFKISVTESNAAQIAGKNNIVGWSDPTDGTVNFFNVNNQVVDPSTGAVSSTVVTDPNAGTAPRAISMTAGCGGTDAFTLDEEGLQLVWDSIGLSSANGAPTVTQKGILSFSAGDVFSPASLINYPMYRRFVMTNDNSCEAAVLDDHVTGTNPDGSTSFVYALALVSADAATGKMTQLTFVDPKGNVIGQYLTDPSLGADVKLAVMSPSGNAVIVETEDVATGSSGLVLITLAPVAGTNNVTATITNLGTVTPTGGTGFFGTSLVVDPTWGTVDPSAGPFVDLGMRTEPLVRVPIK